MKGGHLPTRIAAAFTVAAMSFAVRQEITGATISETFSVDPQQAGWRVVGEAALFQWNATNENLEVTWDSSRTNSYFHRPLGTVLSRSDDFSLGFDLRLRDLAIGTSPGKPYTFQIAIGLISISNAIATNFFRGAGQSAFGPRNLVEFDYFADSGFGATIAPTVVSTNNRIAFSDNHPLEMAVGDAFHIAMTYTASNQVLRTAVTRNGSPYGLGAANTIADLNLAAHPDFRVDALAIMSYSDRIQVGSTQFWGSVRAHGTIDNYTAVFPEPPIGDLNIGRTTAGWRAQFIAQSNWVYVLERTTDFMSWSEVESISAAGGPATLTDRSAPAGQAFYRVRAQKP